MIASVHVADVGARRALGVLRKAPSPSATPGLRHANVGTAARLSGSIRPQADPGRVGLVAFWDDDDSLDRFLTNDPLAATLSSGWHLRLAPLRATGTWPGLPDDVPAVRPAGDNGPAAVLTLGRVRLSQVVRFFRASAKAEGRAVQAPGLTWATGLARPPFVATCSLWESERALATYAYGSSEPEHRDAIAAGEEKPFHHESAFIRFRPYDSHGSLDGKNPLAAAWATEV